MRQLTLDIRPTPAPALDSFVAGANGELMARLAHLAAARAYDSVYLWGAPGSGRSHLLRATARAVEAAGRGAVYVAGAEAGDDLPLPRNGVLLVDDADALGDAAQIALFRAFNTARLIGLSIVVAGPAAPRGLALREDLRTRIGAMLVFEVRALSDEDKLAALAHHARAHGMRLDAEVLAYLITRGRRDLPSLVQTLDALDRLSLELKRPLTVPLLREVLAAEALPPAEDRR